MLGCTGLCWAILVSAVVGYQNVETKDGLTYLAPTFEKVDKTKITLADICPVGDDVGFGGEIIQIFDEYNFVGGYYTYYIEDSGLATDGNGWYDEEGNKAEEELGTGVGVLFESAAATVQFAGQVAAGDVEITEINDGLTYISNPLPVKRNIQDFVPAGDSAGFGGEIIQTFDQDNFVDGYYTYYIEDSGLAAEGNGWYDEEGNKATESFDPGFGFLFESAGDCTIKVTGVL